MYPERTGPALRGRGDMGPPATRIAPPKAKKTVSAASIFARLPLKTKHIDAGPQAKVSSPKANIDKRSVESQSSSLNAQIKNGRVAKRKSDVHPLAIEFRETSDDYRRHLFESASLKINRTLETLLNNLHESTLQTVTPVDVQYDPQASPLKLTAPAKYERMALKLYQPLSLYNLKVSAIDEAGNRVYINSTLELRMADYGKQLAARASVIEQLQKEWETVVGEIWKLGVKCLGKSVMDNLLLVDSTAAASELPSSSPLNEDAESTLFIPEQGASPARRRKAATNKKRVTFDAPNASDEGRSTSVTSLPKFLIQPSRFPQDTVPAIPSLPEQDVKELVVKIQDLGNEQIEELQNIAKEHDEYWKRKKARLALALRSD